MFRIRGHKISCMVGTNKFNPFLKLKFFLSLVCSQMGIDISTILLKLTMHVVVFVILSN